MTRPDLKHPLHVAGAAYGVVLDDGPQEYLPIWKARRTPWKDRPVKDQDQINALASERG